MDNLQITCDRVDREDLDTRYLAGTLSEELAEAFEAHYFECDRCWVLVHGGAKVRAAGRPSSAPIAVPRGPVRWTRMAWAPLAAAAAILVVWIGTRTPRTGEGDAGTTVRGAGDSVSVSAQSSGGVLHATWSSVANAAGYQVRLFTARGDVLLDRRVTDTTLAIARDSIPRTPRGSLFWQVQALDVVGVALARSALIEVPADPPVR